MDEPTSALSRPEVDKLFALVRQLKVRGCGIIYITHRMEEIYGIADRITVLRDVPPVAQHGDPVGDPVDLLHPVRDVDDPAAADLELAHEREQLIDRKSTRLNSSHT